MMVDLNKNHHFLATFLVLLLLPFNSTFWMFPVRDSWIFLATLGLSVWKV
jgi:hypothetical protein